MLRRRAWFGCVATFLLLATGRAAESTQQRSPERESPSFGNRSMIELEKVIILEREHRRIHGVSVALVDDQQIVHAKGYGFADADKRRAADENTIYRVGSISKLFNAVAVMQLVEQGKLDLDAPLATLDPAFRVVVPFAEARPITLRQILCHRSGMVRESAVGGYFDDTFPSIAASVASLADTPLVHPPGTRTKYSNIAVTVAGHIASGKAGQPFPEYAQERILGPLGMVSSSFLMNDQLRPQFAQGYMQIAQPDGRFQDAPAPWFELATVPAGNLYSTCTDLARFAMCLFNQGRAGEARILSPQSLAAMFRPQLTDQGEGFGLGFSVQRFRDHRTVQHMGAVYGFTSMFICLPEQRLAVVVLVNDDIAVGPVTKIAHTALGLLLDAKLGTKLTPVIGEPPKPSLPDGSQIGDYESTSYWARIIPSDGQLAIAVSGQSFALRPNPAANSADAFLADGRLAYDAPVVFERDAAGKVAGFRMLNQSFRRVAAGGPPLPDSWHKYLGSYGPAFIPLIVSERHGHLYAMVENEYDYRLSPQAPGVFGTPPGMYEDEHVVFQEDESGRVHTAVLSAMRLKRRDDR